MNPNMPNRRSMLTGGTLISLSTLLAACVPHDITTAGDGSATSGTPATSSSSGSSAGNNAGSGEYRKADAKGPAQNVPKPNAPENGYRAKTPDGILKTMDAWNQWINYGVQTGDYSKAREFLSSSNDGELKIYREIEALYQRGGWVIDGIQHFEPAGIPRTDDHQTYYLETNHEWDKQTEVEPDGRQETWSSDKEEEIYTFALEHRDGRWQILYSRIEA
ncbi:DUF6318 family protein [Rothia mucilaginosa]|uniref:DUF6318 family protein n=1 Tax=Rothia mucilaginosa TaxID=43675 RepID=UPI0026EB7069|nr:DUF6318 family protein [Rothia mucilaginosa]